MRNSLFFCFIFFSTSIFAQNSIQVASPYHNIVFSFSLVNKSVYYSVDYKNQIIMDKSALSLKFSDGEFKNDLKLSKPVYREATEKYAIGCLIFY